MADVDILTASQAPEDSMSDLVDSVAKVTLTDEDQAPESTTDFQPDDYEPPSRPVIVYTRSQMLLLCRSPLVHIPEGMPTLKDWFGEPNLQTLAKDADVSTTSGANRDRRFRRDPEDTDTPPRPQFRTTLSQPSQMGNFKHQSLRTGDRDREADKERDKEGLRSLSDKFDRDRLTHPSSSTLVRNRERDSAPHLTAGSSTRTATAGQTSNGTSRRSDAREATRRRVGETSDDWRRGAEPPRGVKDDRSDISRRDRDDRERPRSRVRDSSKSRRDTSIVRRDRDDRDKDRRTERESRRDRDVDRDIDDDPRRWRDDGKRDERMTTRREREKDRDRDRGRDAEWDGPDRAYDRFRGDRWTAADEKDGRSKRGSGRERRGDEPRDRDDKRERERDKEREKEKEPAWMETYVPTSSSGGILGSKAADGELDSIQAWKKEQKEKELKERAAEADSSLTERTPADDKATAVASAPPDPQLDEIQLFKLLIKKEEEKRKAGDSPIAGSVTEQGLVVGPKAVTPTNGHMSSQSQVAPVAQFVPKDASNPLPEQLFSTTASSRADNLPAIPSEGPRTLLTIISSGATDSATSNAVKSRAPSEISCAVGPLADKVSSDAVMSDSPVPAQFNPPAGSRLLAFGSRNAGPVSQSQLVQPHALSPAVPSPSLSNSTGISTPGLMQRTDMPGPSLDNLRLGPDAEMNFHRGATRVDPLQAQQQFSPFDDLSRPFGQNDPTRGSGAFGQPIDHLRRTSVASERSQFTQPSDILHSYPDLAGRTTPLTSNNHGLPNAVSFESLQAVNGPAGLNHAAAKGSRFAKFFDSKAREGQFAGPGKAMPPGNGGGLPLDIPMQRPEHNVMLGGGGGAETRTMEDLFVMLNNSAQGQRGSQINQLQASNGNVLAQNNLGLHSLHHHQQQQQQHHQHQLRQQQQQTLLSNRLDSLPDHRLDDRNFVPDGMVPGLRTVPPPRNREPSNPMFMDQLDEQLQVNYHRLPQQRSLDPLFNGSGPSNFPHPGVRNSPLPLQQSQFRGGPSPISSQNPLQMAGQQRIPPGLAHLGGRPPHDTSQFLGGSITLGSGGPSSGLQNNPSQQMFNNLSGNSSGLNFAGGPQMRGMQQSGPQLQTHLAAQNALGGLGHPNNMDLRGGPNVPHLAQLGNPGGIRPGFANSAPQQGLGSHLQAQQIASLRQQQQVPHQMLPHMLPPHLQQQGLTGPNGSPVANDLMALLMGGPRRD